MTRPILPPDGKAYLSSVVMFDLNLTSTVRDTYAALRVLAWGRAETPELSKEELEHNTGKDFQTLYRQLPILATNGVLRVRHAGTGHYSLLFTDGISGAETCLKIENSQKRESPVKDSLISKASKKTKKSLVKDDSAILKIENSQKREAPKAETRQITDEYKRLLGPNVEIKFAAGEGAAAKWIAERYTVEQFRAAYQHFKADKFWRGKLLTLRYLRNQIGPYLAECQPAPLPEDDAQLEADLAYMRARDAAKGIANGTN